ncbi:MAG: hypothetical protein ACI923_001709, partial [Flavobacteriales bacterium]
MSQEEGKNSGDKKSPKKAMNFYWVYGIIGALLLAMLMFNSQSAGKEISYDKFLRYAEDSTIERMVQS